MGGTEKVNYDIVEGLNLNPNYQVDELCFAHTPDYVEIEFPNYKLFRVPIYGIKFSTPIPKTFFSIYRKIRNDYDIIHIHFPNPIASLAPLIFKTRAKIVIHWHCDIVKREQQLLKKLYDPLQKRLLDRASKIIGTSEKYTSYSKDLEAYKNKIEIVPIGIDTSYLKVDNELVSKIKDKYKGKKIVFSLGRLTYYKGFRYLIEAAKYIPDDVVILLGGCGEQEKELRDLVANLQVEDKLKFLGRIPEENLGSYYKAADLFCLPSPIRTEAFGVVLLEAMSMELPIVACNIDGSGVPWVNKDSKTGYNVPVKNARALAEAIEKIITNPNRIKEFGCNAFARYNSLFTKDKMIKAISKIYNEISD